MISAAKAAFIRQVVIDAICLAIGNNILLLIIIGNNNLLTYKMYDLL